MSDEKNCSTCRYFEKVANLQNIKEVSGRCRRFPPRSQAVPTNQGIGYTPVWPVVVAEDFCGEFLPIEH